MATVVLQAAGGAIGSLFGPVGAIIGRAAGALAGSLIDKSLISGMTTIDGTHLPGARIPGAEEGTPITRIYGVTRVGGTLIWATHFKEEATVERSGAKGSGPRVETFRYFANIALGLCEGPIADLRRVWADGRELDLKGIEMRFHRGTNQQDADPLIEAKQGKGNAPAYRGLAYVVFENLPLEAYGNRLPVFQFEVIRKIGALEGKIRAMTLIPGASEHGYSPFEVREELGEGEARIITRNQLYNGNDFRASINELLALCPNLERVAIVASWFGTDLRAGQCKILPGVETAHRDESVSWQVSGMDRNQARLVSKSGGSPAFGGTPSDGGLIEAIKLLKERGVKVFLYPFLLMDIPGDNALDNPYGGDKQPRFPWRGRITCNPAPGQPGSADGTVAAKNQIENFVGNAQANDFSIIGGSVSYSGNDKGYRRMILHYAHLGEVAGGVDGIIIGSELRGLTTIRDHNGAFPFVTALIDLAGDVRAMTGSGTKLTYGADWTEYYGHHPADGSGDVYFHLDPLWACDAIDAVGIDNYMPLADWRDEDYVGGNPDGAISADDPAALKAAIAGGEGYDWYYASETDRAYRVRSPITDGLAGKPWVYRYKDIENWWQNQHFNRINGVEKAQATAWQPMMKPIWFTELGCPAIDRGANQPNVFVDPASSESAVPYFSAGRRSDCMQRRFLEAHFSWWEGSAAPDGMIDTGHIFVWTWDARPIPAFPENRALYADGDNWTTGHWLNGRFGAGTLPLVIAEILKDHGFGGYDVSGVSGDLTGYVKGDISSARQLLEPLLAAFRIDVRQQAGRLVFVSRGAAGSAAIPVDVFAAMDDEPFWTEKRAHDSDFVSETILDFIADTNEYEQQTSRSRRMTPGNDRVMRIGIQGVMAEEEATLAAENLLRDQRLARRSVSLSVSPRLVGLEPGDVISIPGGPGGRFRIDRIEDGAFRRIEAHETGEGDVTAHFSKARRRTPAKQPDRAFSPVVHLMDLPRYKTGRAEDFAVIAVTAKPWKQVVVSSSPGSEGFQSRTIVTAPAGTGRLTADLQPGIVELFDTLCDIQLTLNFGGLQSADRTAVLNGANRLAVRAANGAWEIIGFMEAFEDAPGHWVVSRLLRALGGTGDAMAAGAPADAPVVVLDSAVIPIGLTTEEAGRPLNILTEARGQAIEQAGPFAFSGGVRAETPFAPVHLRAERQANGDIRFSFIRAGRIEADAWDDGDVPLDESEEAYLLEILNASQVVRTVNLSQPFWIYAHSDEVSDFGALQSAIRFRVRQKGRKVALGIAASRNISL